MSDLGMFSYMPNPRIWKAMIAARLCGVILDLRGARPDQLASWFRDSNARPLIRTSVDRDPEVAYIPA
jgi:elongation factor 1-gamma